MARTARVSVGVEPQVSRKTRPVKCPVNGFHCTAEPGNRAPECNEALRTASTLLRGTVNRKARCLRRDPKLIVMGCKLEIFELLLDQERTSQMNGVQ